MIKGIFILSSFLMLSVSVTGTSAFAQTSESTPADALVPAPAISPEAEMPAPVADTAASVSEAADPVVAGPAESSQQVASLPPIPMPVTSSRSEMEILEQVANAKPSVDIAAIPSLFFTVWEHDLIIDARRGLNTRPPGQADGADGVESPTGLRDITLSGIVYRSSKDWTVWLNSMRISPDRIPTELMDIRVFKDYIEIEWFDDQTNQIFPIRLRTYQRFNLDSRIFLPG